MTDSPLPAQRVALLISDVDGTLVTRDKVLTQEAIAAARAVQAAGIRFAVTSSRPPRGLRMLIEPLGLTEPLCGFNGGLIVDPQFRPIESHALSADAARHTVAYLNGCGVETWLFDTDTWYALDPEGAYVPRERRTIQFDPAIVASFDPVIGGAYKIVGASSDHGLLACCETELREALGGEASVARSQPYYLDVTHPLANKGHAVRVLSERLGIPRESIAVIGDGENDVAMFREAGFAIAMGNAAPEVQAAAQAVTATNMDNGFAKAVHRFLLAPAAPPVAVPETGAAR